MKTAITLGVIFLVVNLVMVARSDTRQNEVITRGNIEVKDLAKAKKAKTSKKKTTLKNRRKTSRAKKNPRFRNRHQLNKGKDAKAKSKSLERKFKQSCISCSKQQDLLLKAKSWGQTIKNFDRVVNYVKSKYNKVNESDAPVAVMFSEAASLIGKFTENGTKCFGDCDESVCNAFETLSGCAASTSSDCFVTSEISNDPTACVKTIDGYFDICKNTSKAKECCDLKWNSNCLYKNNLKEAKIVRTKCKNTFSSCMALVKNVASMLGKCINQPTIIPTTQISTIAYGDFCELDECPDYNKNKCPKAFHKHFIDSLGPETDCTAENALMVSNNRDDKHEITANHVICGDLTNCVLNANNKKRCTGKAKRVFKCTKKKTDHDFKLENCTGCDDCDVKFNPTTDDCHLFNVTCEGEQGDKCKYGNSSLEELKEREGFFKFKVQSGAQLKAAIPTWGPTFAMKFTIYFNQLPGENDEIRQVVNVFSAEEMDDEKENAGYGKNIPTVSVKRTKGVNHFIATTQIGSKNEEVISLEETPLETNTKYYVEITQQYTKSEFPNDNTTVDFSIKINGVGRTSLNDKPMMYSSVGVSFANTNSSSTNNVRAADADIFDFAFNSYNIDKMEISKMILATNDRWTKDFAMSFKVKMKDAPTEAYDVKNLLQLVTNQTGDYKDQDLPRIGIKANASTTRQGQFEPYFCTNFREAPGQCAEQPFDPSQEYMLRMMQYMNPDGSAMIRSYAQPLTAAGNFGPMIPIGPGYQNFNPQDFTSGVGLGLGNILDPLTDSLKGVVSDLGSTVGGFAKNILPGLAGFLAL